MVVYFNALSIRQLIQFHGFLKIMLLAHFNYFSGTDKDKCNLRHTKTRVSKPLNTLSKNTIGFTFYRGKLLIGHHWIRHRDSQTHNTKKIQTRLELDLSSYGLPHIKENIMREAELFIQQDGMPVKYFSTGTGGDINVLIQDTQNASVYIQGKNVQCDIRNCSFILESNFVGIEWLFLMSRIESADTINTWFFDINSLQRVPYEAKMLDERNWITNLGAQIRLDQSNVIKQFYYKSQGLMINLEEILEPKWGERIIYEPQVFRYQIPSNARFYCRDVIINSDDINIGGIYRIPKNYSHDPHPFPALLFISGSGTQDRHGFSKDINLSTYTLLDYIANCGFVVLSVDDREIIDSQRNKVIEVGLSDITNDFKNSLESLLSFEPYVDRTRVFLMGHSEGAIISMKLAKLYDLAGIILMAPPGRRIEEILTDQTRNALHRAGFTTEQIEAQLGELNYLLAYIRDNKPLDENAPLTVLLHQRSIKWIREHILTPPYALAREVKCPVAIFFGNKDFQLSPDKDGIFLLNQLRQSGNQKVTFYLLKDVDHLFKLEQGVSNPDRYYDNNTRPISRDFLESVVQWMNSIIAEKIRTN